VIVDKQFAAHGLYRPAAEIENGAGPLGDRNEQAWRNRGAIQHRQAHQRLDGIDLAGRHVRDRLVDEGYQVLVDGDLQEGCDVLALVAALRIVRIEQLRAVSPARLGGVKRAVGLVDDFLELGPV
jgi:hypothetical protein